MNEKLASVQIDIDEAPGHAVLSPRGYLNALTGDHIDKMCAALIEKGTRYFIVNFSHVEVINTIGISILVGIIEKVLKRQGLVYFTGLDSTNREIFDILNLGAVAMIFPDDASAIDHIESDREAMKRQACVH